jgi:1,4-alpha-glucan branching enzyme
MSEKNKKNSFFVLIKDSNEITYCFLKNGIVHSDDKIFNFLMVDDFREASFFTYQKSVEKKIAYVKSLGYECILSKLV